MPRASQTKKSIAPQPPPPLVPLDKGFMRMTVYFQQSEWAALRDHAADEETTMAGLIRKAVRRYVELD